MEAQYIRRYHKHEPKENQCTSEFVKHIKAPVDLVWSLVRRFDQPQRYKPFVSRCVMQGDLNIGSLRQVNVKSGLPATTSTERLELLNDEEHILGIRIIGGDHRLKNYSSIITVHPEMIDGRPGTDGKTTLLHFVVQEIIRSEGAASDPTAENLPNKMNSILKEDDFKKQGLQVVAGLSRELGNVKKSAGMDSDVLRSYVSKLEMGLEKVRVVLQFEKPNMQGKFFESMKMFLKEAEEEITRIKVDERNALSSVKEVTEYFHGDTAKEEAHPFRIFMIVRDFLSVLDHVCKEVGKMKDTMVGSARSFRIPATASLPVLSRYNVRQDHGTLVIESFVVDVPEGNTTDETCNFVKACSTAAATTRSRSRSRRIICGSGVKICVENSSGQRRQSYRPAARR